MATMESTTEVTRNPKDSMKSTWRNDKSQWTIFHWFPEILHIQPSYPDKPAPIHQKTEKIPYVPSWQQEQWVLIHAFIPLVLHQMYYYYTKQNLSIFAAFGFYSICLKAIGIHELQIITRLGQKVGYLDGDKHARDEVPDHSVLKVIIALVSTSTFRPLMSVILAYRSNQTPAQMNWLMLPLEIGLYGIILDFWFYWYHRVMHHFDGLWQFHRTHHLTKHPNPLLTLYADHEQEFFDIIGIPVLTFATMKLMGLPMGYYEWWTCQQFVIWTELMGHSGLRVYATPPSTLNWFLYLIGCDLVIEDHDLHHRKGWKKSHNYGKQTRVWDRMFGTCAERIESSHHNIDWDQPVYIPLL